jgi:hypothetical protein
MSLEMLSLLRFRFAKDIYFSLFAVVLTVLLYTIHTLMYTVFIQKQFLFVNCFAYLSLQTVHV